MHKPTVTATSLLLVALLAFWPGLQMPHGITPLYVALKAARAQDGPALSAAADAQLARRAYAILEKNCSSCHGNGKRLSGGAAIDKDTWNKVVNVQKKVVPGKPEESAVYTLMIDHESPMPPKKSTQRPTPEEIEVVKQWIISGAPNWLVGATATTPPAVVRTPAPTKPVASQPTAVKPAVRKPLKSVVRRPTKAKSAKAKSAKSSTKQPVRNLAKPPLKKPPSKAKKPTG